jgi:hypothetical protein
MDVTTADRVPNKVLLFSGHMIDAQDRDKPRFPPDQEPAARLAIATLLAQLDAGPLDLVVCSGACGGDLLFAEAALLRGAALEIYLPFEPEVFAKESVDFAGDNWHLRFEAACAASSLHLMPQEGGPLKAGEDSYEQVNLWMLDAASRFGAEKVDFICLWDGQGGDGPGGTQHLMQEVKRRNGRIHWLDTTQLWEVSTR